MSDYIPDPIERMEASAERAYNELSQPGGKFKCYECDAIFDPEREGGTTSPHPEAMPVCGKCYAEAYEAHVRQVKEENLLYRKKIDVLEKCNGKLMTALEWYANLEIYKPHPHGPAFDDRDLSFVAKEALTSTLPECSICRKRHGNEIQHPCE